MALIKLAWLFFACGSSILSNSTSKVYAEQLAQVQEQMFYPVELVPEINSLLEVWAEVEDGVWRHNSLVHCGSVLLTSLGPPLVMGMASKGK